MFCHGGGWVFDDYGAYKQLVQQLAVEAGYAVVFIEYSLSPEVKYPTANEEAYGAIKWIANNGTDYGLDTSKIAVCGDSAGGNMAAVLTIMAKERKEFKIGFQLLFYPVTNADFSTASYNEFAEGYFLTKEIMQWFFNKYVEDKEERNKITISPLKASVSQLQNLPPALIITAQFDVLREEGEAYAHKLIAAGVPVTLSRYCTIHDFMGLNALDKSPTSKAAIQQAVSCLKIFSQNNIN